MLHHPPTDASPAGPQYQQRRRLILAALQRDADAILGRMADQLAALPEDQLFGQIEYHLRDLSHDLASRAHQAAVDAGKKRATEAPASSAPTADKTPASSATEPRPG